MSLKKIAELAGVSVSTASRVISNQDSKCASRAVKNKIWAAVRSLNYSRNPYACNLKMSSVERANIHTGIIGYCYTPRFLIENGQNWEMFSAIKDEIRKNGYSSVPFDLTQFPAEKFPENVQGIVLFGTLPQKEIEKIFRLSKNVVCVTDKPLEYVDTVLISQYSILEFACSELRKQAVADFCLFGPMEGIHDELQKKLMGILDAYGGKYFQNVSRLIDCLQYSYEPVSAVIFENHTALSAFYKRAASRKLSLPDGFPLFCLDSLSDVDDFPPFSVRSLHYNNAEISMLAVSLLLDRIRKKHRAVVSLEIQCSLL